MDQELIEYLDRRFDESKQHSQQLFEEADRRWNQRFDEANRLWDQRFGEANRLWDQRFDEAKRYFGVRAEELERKIQLVAEGVANVDEKLDRFQEETRSEFRETQAMIRFSHADLQHQIDNLHQRLTAVEERLGLRPS